MSITLIALISLGVVAIALAGYALVTIQQRREVVGRAVSEDLGLTPTLVLRPAKKKEARITNWIVEQLPEQALGADTKLRDKMIQAGYDSPTAPITYTLVRLFCIAAFPLLTITFAPRPSFLEFAAFVAVSVFVGFMLPMGTLDRKIRQRQEKIRRSVPDALDLLVVCVEAGISLDASILRVAKEMRLPHPELSHELAVVNRKTNAGMPRDEALRGLWQRTGVEELRTLVSSMIQSEKWGTSIATVLRVSAETLRRKRRQLAEKRAAMAPLKMTFPLIFFVLPALFIVIMGPAVLQVIAEFSKV